MPCIYGGGQVQNITFVVQGVPNPKGGGLVEKDKQKKPPDPFFQKNVLCFQKAPTVQTTVFFCQKSVRLETDTF